MRCFNAIRGPLNIFKSKGFLRAFKYIAERLKVNKVLMSNKIAIKMFLKTFCFTKYFVSIHF